MSAAKPSQTAKLAPGDDRLAKHGDSCQTTECEHGSIPHHHGLTSAGSFDRISDSRLLWSVLLNQVLTIGQVIAGVFSGSVSLLSDAAHNFSDANSLLIAYVARRISRRAANQRYTFGYRRAELIGATINLTLLAAVGLFLVYEATHRLFDPQPIIGWLMAAAAGLALAVDLGTAALLWAMSRGSLNVRAAFVHNLVDAAGSLAVLIGAGAIIWQGWAWVDPLLTLLIAGYILFQVWSLLPRAIRILMEGVPADFDIQSMIRSVRNLRQVRDLHHIHVWELDEQHVALEAHVTIDVMDAAELESIKKRIKDLLASQFAIQHSTLEFELATNADDQTACTAHAGLDCWHSPID